MGRFPVKNSVVPEKPEFSVGLEEPLRKLKMKILNQDDEPIIVLTGLGGSGKTTLATYLCWDEQVIGKFKENIIFITFSKTPKLNIIVERLFEHHFGFQDPEFERDEDLIDLLELLQRKIKGSPLLLVLDDVWPGSEALVETFILHLSNYKILVTSRVAFPNLGTTCVLEPLLDEDAITLFRHYALLDSNTSNTPDEDMILKVVKSCKGSPLAIKVIGRLLSHRPCEMWQKMLDELPHGHSILDSNTELLNYFQKILDVMDDNTTIKECFMHLRLFPEDQRIPVTALIDMWAELYGLDNKGMEAMAIINKLESMNLVNVIIERRKTRDADNYHYDNQFILVHDLVRELAIYQSTQEPDEERKRLIIDTNENKSEWGHGEKQQSMMTRIFSTLFRYCIKQKSQQVPAHTLSISIDETCNSNWSLMQSTHAKVLILNLRTNQYSFPEFIQKMSKLRVLIVTNYNSHPCELTNFELLGSSSNLKRIRLEGISILLFATLKNVKKLSLYKCKMNVVSLISYAFPNLVELSIDYCEDIVLLPRRICDITSLKKLNVSNCHNLLSLPQEIGKLVNLEILTISSCANLKALPHSIQGLSNLRYLGVSNCYSFVSVVGGA